MSAEKSSKVIIVSKDDFEKQIADKTPILVDFFATWCGPCQMMAPILDELANEENDKRFRVAKLDIDQAPGIAAKYDVMSVPTMLVFKDGKEVARLVGAMPKEIVTERIIDAIK